MTNDPTRQAALDAFWAATDPDDVKKAWARMRELGMMQFNPPSQPEDQTMSDQPTPDTLDKLWMAGRIREQVFEIERLRRWIQLIGDLADMEADNRGWMARDALRGDPIPPVPPHSGHTTRRPPTTSRRPVQ